jgi:pyruvate dehydrogenase E1 component alpha subunit/2-oxoisovalerate dehydrogenase E1 component
MKTIKDLSQVDRGHAHHLLYKMILIRRFEEKCAELYSATKIRGFLHLYNGEEAIAVGVMEALKPEDSIVATYREHGQALARGMDPGVIMAELYGKQEGCCKGRGGSMHIFDKETRFFGGNAIVAGGFPITVGLALAEKMRSTKNIVCSFFGDGSVAEGEFHEAMNLSALWQVPALYILENNFYAMGTALKYTTSIKNIPEKVETYGIPAMSIDGMDVLAVEEAAQNAIDRIRSGGGPFFLECRTYRFRAHSMFDAELYRSKDEVNVWKERGPIVSFVKELKAHQLITDEELEAIEGRVAKEVQAAVDFAEAGTWEAEEDLTRYVVAEGGEHVREKAYG